MSETTYQPQLTHLPPAANRLGRAFARPRAIAFGCIVTLTAAGWLYLGLLAAGAAQPGSLLAVLCQPFAGTLGAGDVALVWLMWCAMTLAMMLPGAGPTILTYAEIADTAGRKRVPVVSPLVLAGGYVFVWFGFAAAAAALQVLLSRTGLLDPVTAATGAFLSAVIFAAAGLYQFSKLKHACLRLCQRPFAFFFANWTTTSRGVFGLGVRQGLYCLGCCWATMTVMFATGAMNVLWMAALGTVMTAEKMTSTARLSHVVGIGLIVIGLGFGLSGALR